jgi:hypothetical protein
MVNNKSTDGLNQLVENFVDGRDENTKQWQGGFWSPENVKVSTVESYLRGDLCIHFHFAVLGGGERPPRYYCALVKAKTPPDLQIRERDEVRIVDSDLSSSEAAQMEFTMLIDVVQAVENVDKSDLAGLAVIRLNALDIVLCPLSQPAHFVESTSGRKVAILFAGEKFVFFVKDRELGHFPRRAGFPDNQFMDGVVEGAAEVVENIPYDDRPVREGLGGVIDQEFISRLRITLTDDAVGLSFDELPNARLQFFEVLVGTTVLETRRF